MEARVGIEPTHKGFADLSLTTWVPRLGQEILIQAAFEKPVRRCAPGRDQSRADWSGRRDLNPRPSPWQGDALPLSYSRWVLFEYIGRVCSGQRRPTSIMARTCGGPVSYSLIQGLTGCNPPAPYTSQCSAHQASRGVCRPRAAIRSEKGGLSTGLIASALHSFALFFLWRSSRQKHR